MKTNITALFIFFIAFTSCKKTETPSPGIFECGTTGIMGPLRYSLTPYNKSLFASYSSFQTLSFVDSLTHDSTTISYSSGSQVWNTTTAQTQHEGDTVNFGESAGVAYNYGTSDIGDLDYTFTAYPNGIDSLRILLNGGNPTHQIPSHTFFWSLNLSDTSTFSTTGYTPFLLLDSIAFNSQTFYHVYLLQKGNSLSPTDSSNNCYYTKTNGIIAFTDKRFNKFWIRTNF